MPAIIIFELSMTRIAIIISRDGGRPGLGGNGPPFFFFNNINIYIVTNFSNFVL